MGKHFHIKITMLMIGLNDVIIMTSECFWRNLLGPFHPFDSLPIPISRYGMSQQVYLKPVSMVILAGCYVSSGVALTLMLLLPGVTTSVSTSGEYQTTPYRRVNLVGGFIP